MSCKKSEGPDILDIVINFVEQHPMAATGIGFLLFLSVAAMMIS